MTNLRELFTEYHAGFQDFVPWLDHHIEMHRRHPLECAEFGAEWLRRWEAVGKLLEALARVEVLCPPRGEWYVADFDPNIKLGAAISLVTSTLYKKRRSVRIVLLDDTIVREWGAK